MPSFCAWMTYCEFKRSFNEHTKRSEKECGSDSESQISEVGKWLHLENRWELLQEKHRHEVIIFRKRIPVDLSIIKFIKTSFSTAAKIELKNTFIFTLNLHQESLNAPYWIWYHWKDKFLLFKTVYRLIPETNSCKSSRATEIGDPIDFVVCLSSVIAEVCNYTSGAKDAQPGGTGKKPW